MFSAKAYCISNFFQIASIAKICENITAVCANWFYDVVLQEFFEYKSKITRIKSGQVRQDKSAKDNENKNDYRKLLEILTNCVEHLQMIETSSSK